MTLNGKQLAAVMKAALIASKADGEACASELKLIANEMANFNLTSNQFSTLYDVADEMSVDEMVGALKSLDYSTQKYVMGFLVAVVAADGRLAEDEAKACTAIFTLCEFPDVSIDDAFMYWRNN